VAALTDAGTMESINERRLLGWKSGVITAFVSSAGWIAEGYAPTSDDVFIFP